MSYDTPTPGSTDQQGTVAGTVGSNVYVMNGTTASMGDMDWGMNVTSVSGSALAHNFSVPTLGLNIPVVGGSTVVAYLYFDKAGTYTWFCITPCGLGPDGTEGSMSTNGWMTGSLVVQ